MDLVRMQAGMVIAMHIGADEVPEHLGQSGCDTSRIAAVGFAGVAQCASPVLEAEMAWQLMRLPDGVAETSTEVVYELPGQKGLGLALWDIRVDNGMTL
jgi:hypothetical protein